MPNINIDDAYILDNTGKQVDDAVDYGLFNSNPNLLDNAYFVGGGSQLGDGIFPINQRGQTSYNGGITVFDRWTVDGGDFTATLESGGVRVTSTTPYAGLSQILPAYKLQNGETYTYSIVVDGVLHTVTFVANSDGNWANIYYGEDWYVPYQFINGKWTFKIINTLTSNGMNHLISKAKIEKGTVSTLANDVPPDFGEELRKCQRYLWIKTFSGNTQLGSGVALTADQAVVSVITPVPMRTVQNITFTANVLLIGNGQVLIASAVTDINQYDNIARLILSSSGLTAYQTYSFLTTTETTMTIYAEL